MSIYDRYVEHFTKGVTAEEPGSSAKNVQRGKRPLKMPKGYDFSVRNVNWKDYSNDFLLRTDAVWDKAKLYDIFHTFYKSHLVYGPANNKYYVADISAQIMPTNDMDDFEDWEDFQGYNNIDGCVWQFRIGPKVQQPTSLSRFIADKEGDSWYLCFLTFQKFMICNERSPVKLDEVNLFNHGVFEYPCYDEVEGLFENCGPDLFEPLFELYKVRLMSGTSKAPSYARN
jgi:hypothetical protein